MSEQPVKPDEASKPPNSAPQAVTESAEPELPTAEAPNAVGPVADAPASEELESEHVKTEAPAQPRLSETAPPTCGPRWPNLSEGHPLAVLLDQVPELVKEADYSEVYGITLKPSTEGANGPGDFHTLLILQKFLRANQNDVSKAKEQLAKTLAWRKKFKPLDKMAQTFKKDKFNGLGYVTTTDNMDSVEVITWNIYGAVKDYEKTFVPVEEFLDWRIALMELGVSKLNLSSASNAIPDWGQGPDPYRGIQVHDYQSVSFLRMDPRAKAASRQTISLLADYYPETLSRKLFVNVPLVMQWMFAAMKLFVSAETTGKFAVLSDGGYVKGELGEDVPKEYGGKRGALAEVGEELKLE